jgi:capsular exopolysaccharide synthesis family protein
MMASGGSHKPNVIIISPATSGGGSTEQTWNPEFPAGAPLSPTGTPQLVYSQDSPERHDYGDSGTALQVVPTPKITPIAFLRALRRRWLLAVTVGLILGTVSGVGLWFVRPAQYTSHALLRISPAQTRVLPNNSANDSAEEKNYQKTQVALIKSRPLILAALRSKDASQWELIRGRPDPAAYLESELQVNFLEGTDIVRIALSGLNPAELPKVVNAVKAAYVDEVVNVERNRQLALLNQVEKIYSSSEERILAKRETLKRLADTLKTSDSSALTLKQKIALEEYATLQKELATVSSQLRAIQVKLLVQESSIQSPDNFGGFATLVESELDRDEQIHKNMLEVERLEELIERDKQYLNPQVMTDHARKRAMELKVAKAAAAKIRSERESAVTERVRRRLREQAQNQVAQTKQEKAILEKQKKALEDEVALKVRDAEIIGKTSFELEMKRAEIEQSENVIKSLRAERERLGVEIQVNKERVSTLYDAETPIAPNRSVQLQLALAGGIGIFLLSLGGVSYWELRAQRITGGEEVVQELGMRVIGSLPALVDRSKKPSGTHSPDGDALLVESIDSIRTMLLCDQSSGCHRVLMVTSAKNGEGKTTLASHLATSIARTGRRTLLIDGDLRRPSVHRMFEAEAKPGLSEVLAGDMEISDAIAPSAFEDLSLLQAGHKARESIPALAQGRIRELLDALRMQFDFIIIDSCPILPVADALLLGKNVDAVLLSVRPHVSQTHLVWSARERLNRLGIRTLGAVVSGAQTRSHDYVYQYFLESTS